MNLLRKNDSEREPQVELEATLDKLDSLTKEAAQMATAEPQKPFDGKKSEAVAAPSVSNKGSGNLPWDKIKDDIHSDRKSVV